MVPQPDSEIAEAAPPVRAVPRLGQGAFRVFDQAAKSPCQKFPRMVLPSTAAYTCPNAGKAHSGSIIPKRKAAA